MASGSIVVMTGGVAAVSLLALVAVFVVYFSARGPARAGLASVGAAAALVGPAAGIGAASYALIETFSQIAAASGPGGMAATLAGVEASALPMRAGFAAAALTLLVAAGLGWIGRGERPRLPPASARRLVALALPAALSFLLVAGAFEYSRRTRALIVEVVASPAPVRPAGAGESPDSAAADRPRSSAGIAETSQRVALGVMTGVFGVPFLLTALAGFAAATAILAWRVRVPTAFAAVATVWMVLQAALWAAALFLSRTPVAS
jgi:hypothetical protein